MTTRDRAITPGSRSLEWLLWRPVGSVARDQPTIPGTSSAKPSRHIVEQGAVLTGHCAAPPLLRYLSIHMTLVPPLRRRLGGGLKQTHGSRDDANCIDASDPPGHVRH